MGSVLQSLRWPVDEVPELAEQLITKTAEGKILPLRHALQKLVAARH